MAHQADLPVVRLCRAVGLSKSGFYAWLKREPSERSKADAVLLGKIKAAHEHSRGTYGVPRIHAELEAEGARVGRKRIARLMKSAGLQGVHRRRGFKTTKRGEDARAIPDLVEREFSANQPNQLWVADITYVPTQRGFFFLAVVLDVFSRRIVGWSMADHMKTDIVLDALEMAVRQRRPNGVVHHSDQGCRYTSVAFGKRCKEAGVRPSTGSVGDCYDNAMAESFFATLECELIKRHSWPRHTDGMMSVFGFIEGWYNPHRRHSALGYLSPSDFEKAANKTAEESTGFQQVMSLPPHPHPIQAPSSQTRTNGTVTTTTS